MKISRKQQEYLTKAYHRWNIKCGATRSGKTYLDYYLIPKRLIDVSGKDGLNVIFGNSKGSLQRNVIEPMQNIYGHRRVSDIHSDNTCDIFGERVYCLGADKINQVDVVRGSSIKYCYGDEVCTWHKDVFEMLKSRMDKPYSIFDGTCNPESPEHWFKQFIDSDADIFYQQYTLFNNPFLDKNVLEQLCKEYTGVFYNRYILGQWCLAEGLVYPLFGKNENDYYINEEDVPKHEIEYINIGQDFGGNKSKHTFCATAIHRNRKDIYVLASREFDAKDTSVEFVVNQLQRFGDYIKTKWGFVDYVFADSAEQTIINTERSKTEYKIRDSVKNEIIQRIRAEDLMLSMKHLHIIKEENESLISALKTATWDTKSKTGKDARLDIPGTTNICPLDAFEYSWEYWIQTLTR